MENNTNPAEFTDYNDYILAVEAAQDAADDFFYDEPDIDFMFEHDSAMESVGWGTDEDYGYFGGDEW